ncbi:LOW QUALITY PROTEIN: hypothetical protein H112_03472 [Trichophyton rubrum D6]|uniref:Uncharacterized protein n=3 Tax=Trichophyton TaxID=5550 RepID=A0A080WJP7_TRIRC|nr:LOW QUALITY PROTEIN: uncharacterized protein TERG_12190 [Trichophyton rubrum CBS 118892]EZF23916.1 LOW QUALITY PROTEIN: hypothetical protein H100_03476 [Trichophyton rubrum MR850]EZF43003.1 LOW QUALITY PROTEIN: hypothetical protein H102_03471 [Trichophyton rubrum CBS 100081]EZF53603.1 LOW QUALITY PROTEIN: hypothetical protein H103_03481 [Trichophyton rubrum CBS 288.86]EZF64271.1 LOW QUALITY PROTEIN: hypothetical protein H104_03466 [Trichophyton rubrum CBS 289.86]EZF74809.1 LOW QUALITY PROTE
MALVRSIEKCGGQPPVSPQDLLHPVTVALFKIHGRLRSEVCRVAGVLKDQRLYSNKTDHSGDASPTAGLNKEMSKKLGYYGPDREKVQTTFVMALPYAQHLPESVTLDYSNSIE